MKARIPLNDTMKPLTWLLLLPFLLALGCSSFEITSEPRAEIYENGELIGATPYRFNLVTGARSFTLKRYGYVEEDVAVTSLAPKHMHFELQWIGRTRVHSKPEGAELVRLEDGEVLGKTPCDLFLSRPQEITFRLEGFGSVEQRLEPNQEYAVELDPVSGFKSAFYRDIMFTSKHGPVAIFDRVAGEQIGVTPVRLTVEAGSSLEYRMPGFKPGYALISRKEPLEIEITLEPEARVILTGPEGSEVYHAGGTNKIGTVPMVVDIDSTEFYEIRKDGYYKELVAVAPDSPGRIDVELSEIPYKTIVSNPPGADIYRLGGLEKLGTAPFTLVVSEEVVFELKKPGHQPFVLGVGPSSRKTLNVTLAPIQRDDPDAAALGELDKPEVETF